MTGIILILISFSGCTASIERGKASYYGKKGGRTASGERVNPKALTAAHRTLPFNTIVEVTAVKSGKKVRVRITDRGPYIRGRIIDLTPGAFARIAKLSRGVVKVTLRVIKLGKKRKRRRRHLKRRRKRRKRKHHRRKRRRRKRKHRRRSIIGPFGKRGPALF